MNATRNVTPGHHARRLSSLLSGFGSYRRRSRVLFDYSSLRVLGPDVNYYCPGSRELIVTRSTTISPGRRTLSENNKGRVHHRTTVCCILMMIPWCFMHVYTNAGRLRVYALQSPGKFLKMINVPSKTLWSDKFVSGDRNKREKKKYLANAKQNIHTRILLLLHSVYKIIHPL